MYAASRTAGCAYCSAHSCSFARHRGATVEEVVAALSAGGALAAANRSAVQVAVCLAAIPASLSTAARAELGQRFSKSHVE